MKYGLEDRQWELLETLVIQPLKKAGAQVWIFGSRATGRNHKFSDIDILYSGEIPSSLISRILEDAEESTLPIKLDLVAAGNLAESYKESVLRERQLL